MINGVVVGNMWDQFSRNIFEINKKKIKPEKIKTNSIQL